VTYELDDKEYEALLATPGAKRYDHFVNRAADWEEVWLLEQEEDNWALTTSDEGDALAVWPHPRYAEACAVGEWDDRRPAMVPVEEFIDDVVPQLLADGVSVSVFPRPQGGGVLVGPRKLRSDLEGAISQIP
jgi:hypothetical protein